MPILLWSFSSVSDKWGNNCLLCSRGPSPQAAPAPSPKNGKNLVYNPLTEAPLNGMLIGLSIFSHWPHMSVSDVSSKKFFRIKQLCFIIQLPLHLLRYFLTTFIISCAPFYLFIYLLHHLFTSFVSRWLPPLWFGMSSHIAPAMSFIVPLSFYKDGFGT